MKDLEGEAFGRYFKIVCYKKYNSDLFLRYLDLYFAI
jgi:hypothetical protein